jgi:predicted nucleic acid-binding protein
MATKVADLATVPDRVMLDTNVLLAATDESRPEHRDALTVVNDWAARRTDLYTSGQILREYLAVATRPAGKNGLGLSRRADYAARRGRQGHRPPSRPAGRH